MSGKASKSSGKASKGSASKGGKTAASKTAAKGGKSTGKDAGKGGKATGKDAGKGSKASKGSKDTKASKGSKDSKGSKTSKTSKSGKSGKSGNSGKVAAEVDSADATKSAPATTTAAVRSRLDAIACFQQEDVFAVKAVAALFTADDNGDNLISLPELIEYLEDTFSVDSSTAEALFSKHDIDHNGTLEAHEFASLLAEVSGCDAFGALSDDKFALFSDCVKVFDSNGDHRIEVDEFVSAMTDMFPVAGITKSLKKAGMEAADIKEFTDMLAPDKFEEMFAEVMEARSALKPKQKKKLPADALNFSEFMEAFTNLIFGIQMMEGFADMAEALVGDEAATPPNAAASGSASDASAASSAAPSGAASSSDAGSSR